MGTPTDDEHPGAAVAGRRRWWLAGGALAGLLLLVLVVAVVGRYVWFPSYRPSLADGERYGVDVSNHQGDIDWSAVAEDDITFAYIKATEGGDWVDPYFEQNWAGAGAAGLDRGAYHFFTLCRPGIEQARSFLDVVPDDERMLPPAIDLELPGNCRDWPEPDDFHEELRAFVDEVERSTGQPVVLYVGPDFEERYAVTATYDRPVWHRRILLRPERDDWWIWQLSGWAEVDGIDGDADLDVMRGERPPSAGLRSRRWSGR